MLMDILVSRMLRSRKSVSMLCLILFTFLLFSGKLSRLVYLVSYMKRTAQTMTERKESTIRLKMHLL